MNIHTQRKEKQMFQNAQLLRVFQNSLHYSWIFSTKLEFFPNYKLNLFNDVSEKCWVFFCVWFFILACVPAQIWDHVLSYIFFLDGHFPLTTVANRNKKCHLPIKFICVLGIHCGTMHTAIWSPLLGVWNEWDSTTSLEKYLLLSVICWNGGHA